MTETRPSRVTQLAPGLRRVLADNPSAMTHWGTNTYIVGEGTVVVIDPGPADPAHMQAILDALKPGEVISHILVTHSHADHSPLARPLSQQTGAPVLGFGDSLAGRSEVMIQLAAAGLTAGGEGVDPSFRPDEVMADDAELLVADLSIKALWTPGHFGNHLCFQWGDTVFTGDHVMGWASSLVSPPDGNLAEFMASSHRLAALGARKLYPGHGASVDDPASRIKWLIKHRQSRQTAILNALSDAPRDINSLTNEIYTDIPAALMQAAARNVFAHLIDMVENSQVETEPNLSITARYFKASQ